LGFSTNTWAGVLLQSELGYLKEKTKKGLKEERDRTGQGQSVGPFLPSAAMGSGGSSLELCRHGNSGGRFRIEGH
jgi:hypothetical protein